jgi:hypothetical protein
MDCFIYYKVEYEIMTDDDNLIKGTTKWYQKKSEKTGAISGTFAVKQNVAKHIPFENGEELLIEYDEEKGTVCIKKL